LAGCGSPKAAGISHSQWARLCFVTLSRARTVTLLALSLYMPSARPAISGAIRISFATILPARPASIEKSLRYLDHLSSSMSSSAVPALLSLPDEILKLILEKVPLKDRLLLCSLVCNRFRKAAAAATQHIGKSELKQTGWYSLRFTSVSRIAPYLSNHGQHLLACSWY
jgi:hypothetical protein